MTWTDIHHSCAPPDSAEIEEARAEVGSVWRCDTEGCGREWKLTGRPPGRNKGWAWERTEYPRDGTNVATWTT